MAPIASGIASVADQFFGIEDGFSTKGLYHTAIVYDSDENARAALPDVPSVFTSRPSLNYIVKEVNPPLLLGEDALAVRGTYTSDDTEVAFSLIAWRQANIVHVVSGTGYLAAPNAIISRIAKASYRQTAATLSP